MTTTKHVTLSLTEEDSELIKQMKKEFGLLGFPDINNSEVVRMALRVLKEASDSKMKRLVEDLERLPRGKPSWRKP